MTGYLADMLKEACLERLPKALEKDAERQPLAGLLRISDEARTLLDRDIYAFDLSALNAAADLRIDTPARIERLIRAVLDEPRRLYLEADAAEIGVIAGKIRGLLDFDTRHRIEPGDARCGAFVDILGNGRATFRLTLGFPANWVKREPGSEQIHAGLKALPAGLQEWAGATMKTLIDTRSFSIDLSRRIGMSKGEFARAVEQIRGSGDPLIERTQQMIEALDSSRTKGQIIDAAWQAIRFNDLFRAEQLHDVDRLAHLQISAATRRLGYNPKSFGLPIIAMLALLQADAHDIRLTPRDRFARGSRGGTKGTSHQPRSPHQGLRVVTLNLEDRGLQEIYERRDEHAGKTVGETMSSGNSEGTTRTRHPVRGHLFLARNGLMTWRRPHWRGSFEETTIHRVTAPSHRGNRYL